MGDCVDAEILTTAKDLALVSTEVEILPPVTTIEPPAIIHTAGPNAGTRFAEYFTVHIQNPHTRRAYFRNAVTFLGWCERQGYRHLRSIKPMTVAAFIEQLKESHAKPSIKQHLATIRMLFDWLVDPRAVQPITNYPFQTHASDAQAAADLSARLKRYRSWDANWPT